MNTGDIGVILFSVLITIFAILMIGVFVIWILKIKFKNHKKFKNYQ